MSALDDVVLFACGGTARHVVSEWRSDPMPFVIVDPRNAALSGEPELSTPLASGNADAIRARLDGIRVAFVFSFLGGCSGTDTVVSISRIAKQCGCRVVSVIVIPWKQEKERRGRALGAVRDVLFYSDRTLIVDVQTVIDLMPNDAKADAFFRVLDYSLGFAVDNLAQMVEGPFFSTFTERAYTFSYVNDIDPGRAVERALGSTMFPTDPSYGKAIMTVGSGFGKAQLEQAFHAVVSNTGIVPDIVKRTDREDTKYAIFLPVRP